ncbi:MAG: hypothetical protein A2W03_12745 [Candidatus Aminicenantes bacterium RBG_16_63_16]|nr:MAG: hypothetical protein A2W03_12745 [Candidatus Aminicenantes bacterium RBG_16_63_16]
MKTKTSLTLLFLGLAGRSHMTKKILTWVVLCFFLVSSWSCVAYRWEQKPFEFIKQGKREGLKICAVQKKSGEKVEFSKEAPARIKGDFVVENKLAKIAIEKSNIDHPRFFHVLTPPFDLTTKDGHVYRVTQWTELENIIVGQAYAPFPVMPLSDIDLVTIRGVNVGETLLFGLGLPLAIFVFLVSPALNNSMQWGSN